MPMPKEQVDKKHERSVQDAGGHRDWVVEVGAALAGPSGVPIWRFPQTAFELAGRPPSRPGITSLAAEAWLDILARVPVAARYFDQSYVGFKSVAELAEECDQTIVEVIADWCLGRETGEVFWDAAEQVHVLTFRAEEVEEASDDETHAGAEVAVEPR